jgi:peptidoglycan/xylan/chitin deacetylase (PgdA/CDA1 family)
MLRVLTYHRVRDPAAAADLNPSLFSATAADFERHVRCLAKSYRVVSAVEVLEAFRGGAPLPPRSVLVTFDDGYRDFTEIAWPILRRYQMPVVVFVPTSYPDNPAIEFWWDRLDRVLRRTRRTVLEHPPIGHLALGTPAERDLTRRALQRHLKTIPHAEAMETVERVCEQLVSGVDGAPRASPVLGWDELRKIAGEGVTIAAHTRTHPALTRLPPDDARREIRGSREDLLRELGAVAPIFSYPFGLHDDRVVGIVREEGFEAAVTCIDGQNSAATADPLRLRRTNITRRTSPWIFRLRLLRPVSALDRWRHRASADV